MLVGIAVCIWQITIGVPELPAEALQSSPWGPLPESLVPSIVAAVYRMVNAICVLALIVGVGLTISGLVTFLLYRKENPVPYEEEA
jgi:hypothetical protein